MHVPRVGHLHPDDSGFQIVDLHLWNPLHFFSPYLNDSALPGPLLTDNLDLGLIIDDVAGLAVENVDSRLSCMERFPSHLSW